MTPEEKFRFDLQGFLVVKNVLSADEVDALNKLADEVWPASEDDGNRRTSRVSMWGPETQALFDHPNALPYMIELLGPTFRVDHDYSIFYEEGRKPRAIARWAIIAGGCAGRSLVQIPRWGDAQWVDGIYL